MESARQQKIASNPAAYGQYASGYNPQTGVQTFDDGTTAQKFTWESDTTNPSQLYPTNAGTGARLPGDPIPTPIIGGGAGNGNERVAVTDPYADMQQIIKNMEDARASKNPPMYNPNLIKDDSDMDEEIF